MCLMVLVTILLSLTGVLSAKEIELFNDGTMTVFSDTYIEEDVKGSYHEKSAMELELGTCELCRDKRIVFQCDLSTLPSDALVTSITLQLYCMEDLLPSAANGQLYITRKEPDISQVDWYQASNSEKWSKLGGDVGLKPIDKVSFDSDMAGQWVEFSLDGVITELRESDEPKLGFLIAFDDVDHHLYASSESADMSIRPRLHVAIKEDAILQSSKGVHHTLWQQRGNSIEVLDDAFRSGECSLYDLQGRLLQTQSLRNIKTITFAHQATGLYIVELLTAHHAQRKIISLKGY